MERQEAISRGPRWRVLSLWLAIGVLVAAALLGSVFIILGDQAQIAGRAWLTLLLAAAFAGTVVLDAGLPDGPHRWYLPVSTGINAVLVLVGLLKTWGGFFQPADTASDLVWSVQFFLFLWIIVLLRAALILTQTYGRRFVAHASSRATKVFAALALAFIWMIAVLLALPPTLPELHWPDVWWRIVGAATLMTAVLFLIPVIVLAFEPKPKPTPPSAEARRGYRSDLFVAAPPMPPEGDEWAPPVADGPTAEAPAPEPADEPSA